MAKREFLMLSHVYDSRKHDVTGWYASEKLDGLRAFWDGGFTRGKLCKEVPFANTEKDGRLITQPTATGLWSRYGKVIHAPGWWLDTLPTFPLDGELWTGRGEFQRVSSIVKDHEPGHGWRDVKFMVFDAPSLQVVLMPGVINNTGFKKILSADMIVPISLSPKPFDVMLRFVQDRVNGPFAYPLEQVKIVDVEKLSDGRMLDDIVSMRGEGIMFRRPESYWYPERSKNLLKMKPWKDAEATVIGYTFGERTDLGSKLLGKMGAMICAFNGGKIFQLSGFTDDERKLDSLDPSITAEEYGAQHPGEQCPTWVYSPMFPIGKKITFRYRELTDAGLPKEARFLRNTF
jgi:DNA ligase 1